MLIIKNILKKINISPIFFFLAFTSVITGLFKDFLVFTSIIIFHETGHILSAIYYKWKIKKINFYPYGGYIEFNEILNKPIKEEIIIVISGPISQILYFLIIYFLYNNNYISTNIYELFKHYHNSILLFNLIPIYPLDGIKIINLLLSKFIPYRYAHYISLLISIIFIIVFTFSSIIFGLSMNFILIVGVLLNQIIKEKKNHNMLCSKFIFERYMYSLSFNKTKIINEENLKKMYRDYKHVFKTRNQYITEKKELKKIFRKVWLNHYNMVKSLMFVGPLTLQPHRKG